MQVRAARALLAWSQVELSTRAGVAARTIADIETSRRCPRDGTVERLFAIFAEAGVEMIDGDGRIGVVRTTAKAISAKARENGKDGPASEVTRYSEA